MNHTKSSWKLLRSIMPSSKLIGFLIVGLLISLEIGATKDEIFRFNPKSANELKARGLTKDRLRKLDKVDKSWLKRTFRTNDAQIIDTIYDSLQESDGNCPCPYLLNAGGNICGGNSAYSKPGGDSPICYPIDVLEGGHPEDQE